MPPQLPSFKIHLWKIHTKMLGLNKAPKGISDDKGKPHIGRLYLICSVKTTLKCWGYRHKIIYQSAMYHPKTDMGNSEAAKQHLNYFSRILADSICIKTFPR